ncbi:MAG TPA: MFS transporter [Micromonosporaceae bacterium]|nr:MFS transporter [Micromonosporaceae bacterium]
MVEVVSHAGRTVPAGRPARAVIGAVTTAVACVLPVFLIGGQAVQISAELRFDPAGLGLLVSAYFAVSALASVPAGAMVERFGAARTARAAIILSAATLGGIATARSYPALASLLVAAGPANTVGQLAANASLAARVPPGRQGLSFGIKQSAIPLSTLLAGVAVPTVALTAGWRWTFVIAVGLAAGALLAVPPDGLARRAAPARGGRPPPGLVVLGTAAMLAAGAAGAFSTFLVDSAVAGGVAPGPAGLTLAGGGTVCIAVRLVAGWYADRRSGGYLSLVAAFLVVGSAGLALLALPGPVALGVGVGLGFGIGWAWPGLLNYAVVRLHPQAPAAATSVTQTGVYAGSCLGPLAFGTTAASAGYPTAWTGAAAAMLLGATLMWLSRRSPQPP